MKRETEGGREGEREGDLDAPHLIIQCIVLWWVSMPWVSMPMCAKGVLCE
jgi:hypothetical protein